MNRASLAMAGSVLNQQFRYADGLRGWGDADQFGCNQVLADRIIESGPGNRLKVTSLI